MELEQLRIFAAVARSGSFTKAAKQLYISHSTTSRAVSALETELGVKLLERDNRIMGLTPAGELLLEGAETIWQSAQELKTKISGLSKETDNILSE